MPSQSTSTCKPGQKSFEAYLGMYVDRNPLELCNKCFFKPPLLVGFLTHMPKLTKWYGRPSAVLRSTALLQSHRPFVHGLYAAETWNFPAPPPPPSFVTSWLSRKDLPCLARPQTANTATGPDNLRSCAIACAVTSNLPLLNLTNSVGVPDIVEMSPQAAAMALAIIGAQSTTDIQML